MWIEARFEFYFLSELPFVVLGTVLIMIVPSSWTSELIGPADAVGAPAAAPLGLVSLEVCFLGMQSS